MKLFKIILWSGGQAVRAWTASSYNFSEFTHTLNFIEYNTNKPVQIVGTISIEQI